MVEPLRDGIGTPIGGHDPRRVSGSSRASQPVRVGPTSNEMWSRLPRSALGR